MQDDRHLTFDEICGTVKALHQAVEEIIDIAYIEIDNYELFQVCFITPRCSEEKWLSDDSWTEYRITEVEEHV